MDDDIRLHKNDVKRGPGKEGLKLVFVVKESEEKDTP